MKDFKHGKPQRVTKIKLALQEALS